jgi:hypothetical protein
VTETRVPAAVVATKTTAATAMVGAQTRTINNRLKAAAAVATKQQDDCDNDGNGGGGGGDGGQRWRWAM